MLHHFGGHLSKPTNNSPTREECIKDIQRVSENLPPNYPISRKIYRQHGKCSDTHWGLYFQNFSEFVTVAEVKPMGGPTRAHRDKAGPSKEECIADIQSIRDKHPGELVTRAIYRAQSKYSGNPWEAYFPNYREFLEAAGISGTPKTADEKVAEDLIFKENYVYNDHTKTYVTFLKGLGVSITLSKAKHEALKRAYSSMVSKPSTINQICKENGLPRAYFIAYKTAHGWTHDQDPFTKEEHETRSTDDMVQELEQLSRLNVAKEYQKREWKQIQANAFKWDDFEQNVLIPLTQAISISDFGKAPVPKLQLDKARAPYALVINPFDLHIGKAGWQDETGESYSRAEARELLLHHTQELMNVLEPYGKPEKVIIASGSDWFHVDTPDGKTTGGTPQDCDGSYAQMLTEGCDLAREHLDLLRQIAPVDFYTAAGNHDRYGALVLGIFLKAAYANAKDVNILATPLPRQYAKYGNSLLGFGHGDSVKVTNLLGVMVQEAKDEWRESDYYYYFTGHFHHKMEEEVDGITHYQLSSLSGADRWHKQKGYVTSSRALQAFMVSKDRGIIAEFTSPVNHTKGIRGIKMKAKQR
jgi:hypothetical protein